MLHIASHFAMNPGDYGASFLLLGDGSHLTIADIDTDPDYALSGIDLLALSACDTAVSAQPAAGAEIESFGALAQLRGARGILATRWSVDDASTGALMQSLYARRAQDQDITKVEALREAQLALLTGELTRIKPDGRTEAEQAEIDRLSAERDDLEADLQRQLAALPQHFTAIDPARQAAEGERLVHAANRFLRGCWSMKRMLALPTIVCC